MYFCRCYWSRSFKALNVGMGFGGNAESGEGAVKRRDLLKFLGLAVTAPVITALPEVKPADKPFTMEDYAHYTVQSEIGWKERHNAKRILVEKIRATNVNSLFPYPCPLPKP